MRPLPLPLMAGLALAGAAACAVLGTVVVATYRTAGVWSVAIIAFALAGRWAARRCPDSASARRLLLCGVVATSWYALSMVELLVFDSSSGGVGLWLLNALVVGLDVALPVSVMAVLVTFPDGQVSTAPGRWLIRLGWAVAALLPVVSAVGERVVPAYVLVWNLDVTGVGGPIDLPLDGVAGLLVGLHESALAVWVLLGAIALAAGYPGRSRQDRVRVRWLVLAGMLLALDGVSSGVPSLDVVPVYVSIPLIGLFPVLAAVGIAAPEVLDVDEAIRRTALFALLWALLSLMYVALAGALGTAASTTRGVRTAVPITVAVTLAFHPLWQSALARLRRVLFGRGLDGDELLRRLGRTLEHTHETGPLARALAGDIRDGLGVSWVRISLEGEPVAAVGARGESAVATTTSEVVHEGTRLGMIECGPRARGVLRGVDRRRLQLLGKQVGLAAHNARLAQELSYHASELTASRVRIVSAEEAGRRRIGRDIHDGIQQDLVAMIAKIGLVEAVARRDPMTVPDALAGLRSDAGRALADLRELASGIHPSVLDDRGLIDAIEARAARLSMGVTILDDDGLRGVRFPAAVEGAIYFTVSEALTNTLKHAGAAQVIVRVSRQHDALQVEVCDDGSGFAQPVAESGLAGLADRLAALEGRLSVSSRPGRGTTLRASVPLDRGTVHV